MTQTTQEKRKPILAPWPGPWKLWAEKYCRNHGWRVAHTLGDFDDAVAECAMIFVECQKRYGAIVDSPQWFMALYKRMVQSWFTEWANYNTRQKHILELEGKGPTLVPGIELEKLLIYRTADSSNEVKEVVKILLNGPIEALSTIGSDLNLAKNHLQRVYRLAGIKPNEQQKVQKELRKALLGKV